jgi:hypothetical protein
VDGNVSEDGAPAAGHIESESDSDSDGDRADNGNDGAADNGGAESKEQSREAKYEHNRSPHAH